MIKISLNLILLVFLSTIVSCALGSFSTDTKKLPIEVKRAWGDTWALYNNSVSKPKSIVSIGSAYLWYTIETANKPWNIIFLTATHVLPPQCQKQGSCEDAFLVNSLVIDSLTNNVSKASAKYKFKVLDVSTNPDLALIAITESDLSKVRHKPKPHFDLACFDLKNGFKTNYVNKEELLYLIGHPRVLSLSSTGRIYNSNNTLITKRWSSGHFEKQIYINLGKEEHYFTLASNESLQGNSGGPLVNEQGDLIGISTRASGHHHHIKGSEDGPMWKILVVRCAQIYNTLVNLSSKYNK